MKAILFRSILLLMLMPALAQAQQKDSTETMRRFIAICSGYKQAPLHLAITLSTSSNIITSEEDTAVTNADFYITAAGSYLRFGELEQLVNDSMALMVSDKMQQMILFANAKPILAQMKAASGIPLQDSSVKNMTGRYRIKLAGKSEKDETIELSSRANISGSDLPREVLTLRYGLQSKEPLEVISISRRTVHADSTAFLQMQQNPAFAGRLITKEDGGQFVIKETVSRFLYKEISHDAGIKPPALVSERIVKNEAGAYVPAAKWKAYALSLN